ncbi:YaiO family outer membrane beta-barrel protein [Flavobacterium sp.]|uniref:YaiO family outer membrane beta-barrel protein n=1 Tax=Flavobacterium sp. TaxID=239 RepID=UPI00286DAA77|nr:YaiO family outer membrane beta-barrel protein [Flavobacterium sp.]
MKKFSITIFVIFILNLSLFAQKVDTDSLLIKTHYEINTLKNYPNAIKLAQLGIKKAPNYLDFHLALGRAYYKTQQIDSARHYFNYVIDKNPKYNEAFTNLIQLEINQNRLFEAITAVNKALVHFPDNKEFELLRLKIVVAEENDEQTIDYLNVLLEKYPDDKNLKQQLVKLKTKSSSNRVGISYNNTSFSRDGVGPWHLIGLQYIRERKKLSLIGYLNYAKRLSFDSSTSGVQFGIESYFKNNKKSYSMFDIAYSYDDEVFPKLRLAYSYFHSFNKGWEADAGLRYTKTTNFEFYAAVFGVGKYVGNYWFNLKSYLQFFESKSYPSFTATARYYFDTKYDYATAFFGYGTSPDERITLGQFQERFKFSSYRFGMGYHKQIWENYIFGIQGSVNRQEYKLDNFQNEYDVFISMQYKF